MIQPVSCILSCGHRHIHLHVNSRICLVGECSDADSLLAKAMIARGGMDEHRSASVALDERFAANQTLLISLLPAARWSDVPDKYMCIISGYLAEES